MATLKGSFILNDKFKRNRFKRLLSIHRIRSGQIESYSSINELKISGTLQQLYPAHPWFFINFKNCTHWQGNMGRTYINHGWKWKLVAPTSSESQVASGRWRLRRPMTPPICGVITKQYTRRNWSQQEQREPEAWR